MSPFIKKWTLLTSLLALLPATIVCDVPGLDGVLHAFDRDVYYDGHCCDYYDDDHHHHDCWSGCDDEWSFDFDWWW